MNRYEIRKYANEYSTLNDLAKTRTNLQYNNTQGLLTIRTIAILQWTIQIIDKVLHLKENLQLPY